MEPDPILEEIHAIRETLSMVAGDDIRKIAVAAQADLQGAAWAPCDFLRARSTQHGR